MELLGQTARGFRAILLVFFACLAVPAAAQTGLHRLQVPGPDGLELDAWLARPEAAGPVPTVILLHGCGGLYGGGAGRTLAARHAGMAERLLAEGYAVLLPDSLTPRGERELCTQAIGQRAVTQRERRLDVLAARAWVAGQAWADPARVAVLGWSHGGSAVLAATDASHPAVRAAAAPRFVAAIAFYPGCSGYAERGWRPGAARTALFLGADDDWTPPAPCQALAAATGIEVHTYAGAVHGFDAPGSPRRTRRDVPNGTRPGAGVQVGSNPAARAAAYARVSALLREAFEPASASPTAAAP